MRGSVRQHLRGFFSREVPSELVRFVLLPALAQRAALLCVVYVASFLVTMEWVKYHALPGVAFFDNWLRWDSYYYMLIATEGYHPSEWGNPSTFFPLYPWIIRALSYLMPLAVAALVVAHLATLTALCLLYLIGRRLYDAALARRAVWAALLFPTAYFLSAGYSESTYLAFATGALLAWLHQRKVTAIGLAAAATLARPVGGFCFSISFVIGWLARRSWRDLPLIAVGPALGGALYALTHYLSSGDVLAPFHVQHAELFGDPISYQPSPAPWWRVLADEGPGKSLMLRLLNWGAIALVGAAGAELWRRRELELAFITWLCIAVPLAMEHSLLDAFSMARFALAAFPLFFVLARWAGDGERARVLGTASAMLQVLLAVCFATWRWVE